MSWTPEAHAFIAAHINDDPHRLLLSAHRYPGIPMALVAAQIESLRKVRDKIPGWYNPALRLPPPLSVEQASSEHTARFKASLFSGERLLDLTGGMGVDTWHWAQRFKTVDYVEQQAELVASARHNFETLGSSNIRCFHQEAEDFLAKNLETYELIYIDPARRGAQQQKVFFLRDCRPDVIALTPRLLERAPKILIKTSPLLDITAAMRDLGKVSKVWIVSVGNECKEVLFLLERQPSSAPPEETPIEAVAISASGADIKTFSYTRAEEQSLEAAYAPPMAYLYEPDAAVLKAGAFKTFAHRFGLYKLHPNTQLYTSERAASQAPARIFKVEQVCKYDRKALQAAVPEGRANITTRNFPDSPADIRKRTGLADGGEVYLFAATLQGETRAVIVCRKL